MIELECLPYGTGQDNDGVCLQIKIGPHRGLLDCGLTNLSPVLENWAQSSPVDFVVCSHAHPDHAQGLLELHQRFPNLTIYASEVTNQLMRLNWLDHDVDTHFCQTLPWRSPVEIQPGLTLTLCPAGHLPGAAASLLTYHTKERDYKLFYTGDFLLSSSRLVEGLPLEELRGLKPDVLILEGSYGTARHPHRRQQENHLAERIHRAIAHQQSVILPTPTLGLAQEILMLLRSHHHFTGRDIDIWVDGKVAIGCDLYLELLPYLPSTVQNFARYQPLFWDDRIRPQVRRLQSDVATEQGGRKQKGKGGDRQSNPQINRFPCIVFCDRPVDLSRYCRPDTGKWLVLVPEEPGRIGSANLDHYPELHLSKALQAKLDKDQVTVDTYLLGEHCDGAGTTQLIHNLRPQHVIFLHGLSTFLSDLTGLEELQNRYHLHTPAVGTRVELPIGETFHQPAPPETRYEGELTELETLVLMTLPETLRSDPRWPHFADTGLIEARWQGEELVLRGISQRDLLTHASETAIPPGLECCGNCQHFRSQRCWSQASPLFGFKVTPDGFCPAFESSASNPKDSQ